MLKEFSWKFFEKTGDIDAYIFYKEINDLENDNYIKQEVEYQKELSLTS